MLIAGVQPRSGLDKRLEGSHRLVCLHGLVYVPVVLLQCKPNARGISRWGQARQARARARGGARDLQELLSEFSVEACLCADHEFDLLILRGLIRWELRRRRLLCRVECFADRRRVVGLFLILRLNNGPIDVARRSKTWRLRGSGDLRCAGRRELCGRNGGIGEFVI
jgi:hypothetical protein